MSATVTFPNIDTSYWLTKDKGWMETRKTEWEKIAHMLKSHKSAKALTVIKQYYLRGKMPDWGKFIGWDDYRGHLDIFCFLWLHPSWDETVLRPLRDAYISYDRIVLRDVKKGYGLFVFIMIVQASIHYDAEEAGYFPYTGGHNELLFKVLMEDSENTCYTIPGHVYLEDDRIFEIPKGDISYILHAATWLCIKEMLPFHEDMLLQYDRPLEWWYQGCCANPDYFKKTPYPACTIPQYQLAFYRIHHFDIEKEGDTCRTRFVRKVRSVLDEREFFPEFKQIWLDVKADAVELDLGGGDLWDPCTKNRRRHR